MQLIEYRRDYWPQLTIANCLRFQVGPVDTFAEGPDFLLIKLRGLGGLCISLRPKLRLLVARGRKTWLLCGFKRRGLIGFILDYKKDY